jgi:hypothetical protein
MRNEMFITWTFSGILRMTKSRRMRLICHIMRMRNETCISKVEFERLI